MKWRGGMANFRTNYRHKNPAAVDYRCTYTYHQIRLTGPAEHIHGRGYQKLRLVSSAKKGSAVQQPTPTLKKGSLQSREISACGCRDYIQHFALPVR